MGAKFIHVLFQIQDCTSFNAGLLSMEILPSDCLPQGRDYSVEYIYNGNYLKTLTQRIKADNFGYLPKRINR